MGDYTKQTASHQALHTLTVLAFFPVATTSPASGNKGTPRQNFAFDRVLGPDDGQLEVYETVEP